MVIADFILANFKNDYASLINSYNNSMGGMPAKELRAKRDSLVQATQTSLLGALAPLSVKNLRNHITREKASMKVAREVQ